jgi:pimeloyl-ACP methyl ester carboxylesterase
MFDVECSMFAFIRVVRVIRMLRKVTSPFIPALLAAGFPMKPDTKKAIKKWAKRIAIDGLVIVVAQYLIVLFASTFLLNSILFQPHEPEYTWQTPYIINIGDEGMPVAAYWQPHTNAIATLLYSHGNAEDIGDLREVFNALAQSGISVLAYDYPGYGLSGGKPSENRCYEAAEKCYSFLTTQKKIKPEDIIILGRSVGSGPACYLAEKYPVRGLVLESGFLSAQRVLTRVRLLPIDTFPNIERIKAISCRKLFIHGTHDSVIPFWHGKKMYELSTGMKQVHWVPEAGHDDLLLCIGLESYTKRIKEFSGK